MPYQRPLPPLPLPPMCAAVWHAVSTSGTNMMKVTLRCVNAENFQDLALMTGVFMIAPQAARLRPLSEAECMAVLKDAIEVARGPVGSRAHFQPGRTLRTSPPALLGGLGRVQIDPRGAELVFQIITDDRTCQHRESSAADLLRCPWCDGPGSPSTGTGKQSLQAWTQLRDRGVSGLKRSPAHSATPTDGVRDSRQSAGARGHRSGDATGATPGCRASVMWYSSLLAKDSSPTTVGAGGGRSRPRTMGSR